MAHGMAHSTSQGPPLLPQILASLGKSPIDDPNLEIFPHTIPSLSPQWVPGIKAEEKKKGKLKRERKKRHLEFCQPLLNQSKWNSYCPKPKHNDRIDSNS